MKHNMTAIVGKTHCTMSEANELYKSAIGHSKTQSISCFVSEEDMFNTTFDLTFSVEKNDGLMELIVEKVHIDMRTHFLSYSLLLFDATYWRRF